MGIITWNLLYTTTINVQISTWGTYLIAELREGAYSKGSAYLKGVGGGGGVAVLVWFFSNLSLNMLSFFKVNKSKTGMYRLVENTNLYVVYTLLLTSCCHSLTKFQ